MIFQSKYPFNQEIIGEYEVFSLSEVNQKLALAKNAFTSWKTTSIAHRAELFEKMAVALETQSSELGKLISLEMGKVFTEAKAEVEKCATVCRYYAQHTETILTPKIIKPNHAGTVYYQPTGAVFAIMPWNFPFWQVFRYASAALMAGNVTLLKHAPNVTGCSLAIEKLFLEVGFPEGVFQSLVIDIDLVEHVIAADIVQGVTLTGSERAGASVGALAGKYIKKSVLELGGSDPVLVLDDADVEMAAQVSVASRLLNAGQTCISAKRFFVTEKIYEAYSEAFLRHFKSYKQGDPFDPSNKIGPLCREDIATNLYQQYERSLAEGATLAYGGELNGCNFMPTFLSNVTPDMVAGREETFGPLAAIFKVKNEEEMIFHANNSPYGLGASVWSTDHDHAKRVALAVEAGSIYVNSLVKSDPYLPFGGIKRSGYGRELSHEGMLEFCNAKTVVF